jgi:hypothetical protein
MPTPAGASVNIMENMTKNATILRAFFRVATWRSPLFLKYEFIFSPYIPVSALKSEPRYRERIIALYSITDDRFH